MKCLRIPRSLSYVDAAVLDNNTLSSRDLAKNAFRRKMETKKFFSLLVENDEARQLYYDAVKLDVNDNEQFFKFIGIMEKVLDLLGLRKLR